MKCGIQFRSHPGVYKRYDTIPQLIGDLFDKDRPTPRSTQLIGYLEQEVQSGRGRGRRRSVDLERKIEAQTRTGLPLQFAVIALAHKNPSTDICGGRRLPDLAELGFLLHLDDIMRGVQHYYPPGARFTVLTEGDFYKQANLFDVLEPEIAAYEQEVVQMARCVAGDGVVLHSLSELVTNHRQFQQVVDKVRRELSEGDYYPYLNVMQKSMTSKQKMLGKSAVDMARDYVALHKAKHMAGDKGGSLVYQFLERTLGINYIYCSVTSSIRSEVLNIDPYFKPGVLPQHGLGVVAGGSYKIRAMPAIDLEKMTRERDVRTLEINERQQNGMPFGFVVFGRRRP